MCDLEMSKIYFFSCVVIMLIGFCGFSVISIDADIMILERFVFFNDGVAENKY